MTKNAYHHGDLRATLLAAAAEDIAASGVDSVSLRGLVRRAGVSHAAPTHHFGDKRGLLTALAAEGFHRLADELESSTGDLRTVALAYIRFALDNPAHFAVMFRRDLLRTDDAALVEARARSGAVLERGVAHLIPGRDGADRRTVQLAAWSLVHGFASLWLDGALTGSPLVGDAEPEDVARRMVGTVLFDGRTDSRE